MRKIDTHIVLVRPLATGRWEILEYATSAKSALAEAKRMRDGLSRGDLILAIDMAEISVISERSKCLYYVNKTGDVNKAPDLPQAKSGSTWLLEWEGPEADAGEMLKLCDKIDRKLLVTTVCAVARFALPYVQDGEHETRILIEMTEAWTRGEATIEQVKKAKDVARAVSFSHATYAACAAANATWADYANDTAAVYHAAHAMHGNYVDSYRQLANVVRKHIPLHVLLESLA